MYDKFKTLSRGRRDAARAGSIAATVCLVFLFVLAPVSALAAENTTWTKYDNSVPGLADSGATNGRIPVGTAGAGDDAHVRYGSVIKDGSIYKMWYTGSDGNWRIYYATSYDGLNWFKYNNAAPTNSDTISTDGRIGLGADGTGDDNHVYYPSVIKDGSTYKMWYGGHDGGTDRIYYATSTDGLTWTKYDNSIPPGTSDTTNWGKGRIPIGTSGKGDVRYLSGTTVVKDGSTYKMWYYGSDGSHSRIYHATSSNGLTWTKFDNSVPPDTSDTTNWGKGRIPLGTSGGDTNHAYAPSVIKDGSLYKMWYVGTSVGIADRIYHATSTDGLTWTKYTNAIPTPSNTTGTKGRIPLGESGRGDTSRAYYPMVIKDGDTYKMWYVGYGAGSKYCIYHATSPDGLTWTKKDNTFPDASDMPGNGRIPLGTTGKGDDAYIEWQTVIKDSSTYKMWYSGYKASDSKWRIYYATSWDGLTWVKYDNNAPVPSDSICTNGTIALGSTAGTGDKNGAMAPSVIIDDSLYKMWYTGRDAGNTNRIYYATSSNGLTWTKYTNAIPLDTSDTTNWGKGRIPLGESGAGDEKSAGYSTVIKDGSTYKMWYTGRDGGNTDRIYHATSSDGLTWMKYTNAVPPDTSDTTNWGKGRIPLGESESGDEKAARWPTVIKVGSTYKMWYTGTDTNILRSRIYYATSPNGLTWTKFNNEIPTNSNTTSTDGRIGLGISGGDDNSVSGPCVIKEGLYQEGYKYKMWYGGHCGTYYRIYHATCDQPPKAGTIFYGY